MLNCLLHTLSYTSKWLEGLARLPGIFSSRALQPADMLYSPGRGAVAGFPDKGGKACCPSQSLQGTAHGMLRARGRQKNVSDNLCPRLLSEICGERQTLLT